MRTAGKIVKMTGSGKEYFATNLWLATILNQMGYEVEQLCEINGEVRPEHITGDTVMINVYTATANKCYHLATQLKDRKIIMGGPHIAHYYEEASCHADHVIVGELENVIDGVLKGTDQRKIIFGEQVKNLDSLPFMNYGLLDFKPDFVRPFFSRGCNHHCSFCDIPTIWGDGWRTSSVDRMVAEFSSMAKFFGGEVPRVDFMEPNWIASAKRIREFLQRIRAEGIKIKHMGADCTLNFVNDDELVREMQHHKITLGIGFETVNPVTRSKKENQLGKTKETEIYFDAIKKLQDQGVWVHGFFSYGYEEDTPDSLKIIEDFVHKSKMNSFALSILTPFGVSPLGKKMRAEQRILTEDWDYYDYLHFVYRPASMTAYEAQKSFNDFMIKYYTPLKGAGKMIQGRVREGFKHLIMSSFFNKLQKHTQPYLEFLQNGK